MSHFFGTKWPRVLLVVALAVAAASFLPKVPRDQSIRVDLGDLASRVTLVRIRWAPASEPGQNKPVSEDWTGEVTFRYEKSRAPRIVQENARLADGDYLVQIELESDGEQAVTTRTVPLSGGSTTVDVAAVSLEAHPAGDAAP